jgi:hypothetical protein
MSPWKRRLRRAALGGVIVVLLLSVAFLLRYHSVYILPPEPTASVSLPRPNGYDTLAMATKLQVSEVDGVGSMPRTPDEPWPLAGRKKLLAANAPALNQMRTALRQDYLIPPVAAKSTDEMMDSTGESIRRSQLHTRYREFARLLACAATTDAEEGNLPAAARDAADAIELGGTPPGAAV